MTLSSLRPIPAARGGGAPPFGADDDESAGEPPVNPAASPYAAPVAVVTQAPAPVVVTQAAPTAVSAQRRAGAAVILAGVGVGTGALLGGLWGAGSGLFVSGAAINAYRAHSLWKNPAEQGEAVKTTVMAVLGLGLAGYLGYRSRQAVADDDDDD